MRHALAVVLVLLGAVAAGRAADCPPMPAPPNLSAQIIDQSGSPGLELNWEQPPYDDQQRQEYVAWSFVTYRVERRDATRGTTFRTVQATRPRSTTGLTRRGGR